MELINEQFFRRRLQEVAHSPVDRLRRPLRDDQDPAVEAIARYALLVKSLEVPAVLCEDGPLLVETPVENVPVLPTPLTSMASRSYIEAVLSECVYYPQAYVLVREDLRSHDNAYLPAR
jgi:hypothetical protein